MSASRLLNEQRLFVDEEEITIGSGTSNGKKKKKNTSRDEPALPFPFKDEQTRVQGGEVSAAVIQPISGGTRTQAPLKFLVPSKVSITWTSVHKDKHSTQMMEEIK